MSVVTMHLKAAEAASVGTATMHPLAGRVRNGRRSLVGPWSLDRLAEPRCDALSVAADATGKGGVPSSVLDEARPKRAAMRAIRTIPLADHPRLGRRSFVPARGLPLIDPLAAGREAEPHLAPCRAAIPSVETG